MLREFVFHASRKALGLSNGKALVHCNREIDRKLVPNPTRLHIINRPYA